MLDWLILLEAFLRAMRAAAFVTGALVVVDSIGVLLIQPETPPHNPRANAAAWLIIALTVVMVSGYLLSNQYVWINSATDTSMRASVVTLWTGLVAAFTARAMARAKRPCLPLAAAVLMVMVGAVLGILDPPAP